MRLLTALLLMLPIVLTGQSRQVRVEVSLKGIPDNTLYYISDKITIDSVLSDKGVLRFAFSKKTNQPEGFLILSKDRKQGYLIWIEDSTLFLDGTYNDLSLLKGKGSRTHEEFIEYMELTSEDRVILNKLKAGWSESIWKQKADSTNFKTKIEELKLLLKNKNTGFVTSHPNSTISTYILLLETTKKTFSNQETSTLFSGLGKEQQNSKIGQDVLRSIQLYKNPKIGGEAPPFTLKDTSGNEIRLTDFRGKTIVLIFWASWCGPCRRELPEIRKAAEEYKDENLEFIAVSLDENKEAWLNASQKDEVKWINLSDLKGWTNEAALIYGVASIPEHFLISPEGKILAREGQFGILKSKIEMLRNKN